MVLSFLLVVVQVAFAQSLLAASGEVPRELGAGDSGIVHLNFRLDDPGLRFDRGVLFLNIVENSRERNYPQAAHRVFSGASEEPAIFRRVFDASELSEGLETVLRFQTRGRAPPGEYVLVVQLFGGDQTDPHRVRAEDKLGHASFPFRIVDGRAAAASSPVEKD
ncbi:MAG: hypothetical protein WD314_11525 [Trueperaceae bacterium]